MAGGGRLGFYLFVCCWFVDVLSFSLASGKVLIERSGQMTEFKFGWHAFGGSEFKKEFTSVIFVYFGLNTLRKSRVFMMHGC